MNCSEIGVKNLQAAAYDVASTLLHLLFNLVISLLELFETIMAPQMIGYFQFSCHFPVSQKRLEAKDAFCFK